jgi:hypothetical protein
MNSVLLQLCPDQVERLINYSRELDFTGNTERAGRCILCESPAFTATQRSKCLGVPELHSSEDLSELLDELPVVIPGVCQRAQNVTHVPAECPVCRIRRMWAEQTADILDSHRGTLQTAAQRERRNARAREVSQRLIDEAEASEDVYMDSRTAPVTRVVYGQPTWVRHPENSSGYYQISQESAVLPSEPTPDTREPDESDVTAPPWFKDPAPTEITSDPEIPHEH